MTLLNVMIFKLIIKKLNDTIHIKKKSIKLIENVFVKFMFPILTH